jgi:hypothetical protein
MPIARSEVQEIASMKDQQGWLSLQEDARLSGNFLGLLWKTRTKQAASLLQFMTKFGLLVPLQVVDQAKDLQWLVPAVLKEEPFQRPAWPQVQ